MDSKNMNDLKFKEYFEKKIYTTIKKYGLCSKTDKVVVAVSGGKDSTTCLFVLKILGYNVEAMMIDAKIGEYTEINKKNIEQFCKEQKIKLHIISFRDEFGVSLCYIRSLAKSKGYNYSSCRICGILKRYLLNKYSKELGFDCLATGHNLDDEAQAFLMNIFRNDTRLAVRQGPISGVVKSSKFVKRIKPLYNITEEEVIRYSKYRKFPVHYGMCPCSSNAYRRKYLNFLDEFEKEHPDVKYNILKFHETLIAPLKKQMKLTEEDMNLCTSCGEPSSKGVCMRCQLFQSLEVEKNKKRFKKGNKDETEEKFEEELDKEFDKEFEEEHEDKDE